MGSLKKTKKVFLGLGKAGITGGVTAGVLSGLGQAGGSVAQQATAPALSGLGFAASMTGPLATGLIGKAVIDDVSKFGKKKKKK